MTAGNLTALGELSIALRRPVSLIALAALIVNLLCLGGLVVQQRSLSRATRADLITVDRLTSEAGATGAAGRSVGLAARMGRDEIDGPIRGATLLAMLATGSLALTVGLALAGVWRRRRAEETAAATAAVLAAEFELSPDGILVVGDDGAIASANQRFVDMWRIPADIFAERSDERALQSVLGLLVDPQGFLDRVEYLNTHKDEHSHEELQLTDGRTIERHSAPLAPHPGRISGRVWFFRDITEQRAALAERSRLAAIVESSLDAIYTIDLQGVVRTWNAAAEALYGYTAEEMVGSPISLIIPEGRRFGETEPGEELGESPRRYEAIRRRKDGSLLHLSAVLSPVRGPDGALSAWSAIAHDITERKRAESRVRRTSRALATLSQANAALVAAADTDGLYRRMCDIIVETGGFRMAWIGLAQDDDGRSILPVAHAGYEAGYLDTVRLSWDDVERGRGPAGRAIRTGLTQINRSSDGDPAMSPWRADALARGFLSNISLPLRDNGTAFGVLTIYAGDVDAFDSEETSLFEELAANLAYGVVTLRAREARDRLAAIVESSRDAIFGKTLDGVITSWNHGATAMYGYEPEEIIGRHINVLVPPDRLEEIDWILRRVARGQSTRLFETERIRKDGERITVALLVSPTLGLDGKVNGASAIGRDITDQKRIERDLARAARFDSLTGLPNRGTLVETLTRLATVAHRGERNVGVMLLDLDHFKDVNDTLGHAVGDKLLQQVARRLLGVVDESDMVSRFGGDEFGIVLHGAGDPTAVALLAQQVLDVLAEPYDLVDGAVSIGASLGLALFGADAPSAETMLSFADIALHRAKSEGRGVFRFFTETMDQEVRQRVRLGVELRAAISSDELFLVYQPQVEAACGRIIGLEALVRWNHPTQGLITPAMFIPISEQIGLAIPLGRWVMNEACRQIRAWLDAALITPTVAINVSGMYFRTPGELERDMAEILAAHDLSADRLELELTETVLMDASKVDGETLRRLRGTGAALAIDDFGTGYSSLDYLRRFRVDRIKIDQNFVRDLEVNPGDEAIIKATIGLGRALGLKVMAEGVETERQRDALLAWACEEMQGYFFARPLPADEVTGLLRDGARLPR